MKSKKHFSTVPISQVPVEERSTVGEKHRPIVLVVDDEEVIGETLSTILSLNGYAPLTAHDGVTALELASLVPPDVLLTDVVMPRMNGIELAMKVRQAFPDCTILLFSGQAEAVDLLAPARLAGYVFTLLSKPVHPLVLLDSIAKSLSSRGAADGPDDRRMPDAWNVSYGHACDNRRLRHFLRSGPALDADKFTGSLN
jgi:CheY-like chemotaxis protein